MLLKKFALHFIRSIDDFFYERMGPIRVLFIIRNQLGWQCLLPIITLLTERKNVVIGITIEFEGCVEIPDTGFEAEIFNRFYVNPKRAIWKKWHSIVISNQTGLYFKRNSKSIFTHHGCGFGNDDISANATHVGASYLMKIYSEPNFQICFVILMKNTKAYTMKNLNLHKNMRNYFSFLASLEWIN